jgi:hypothetical protein
VQENSATAGKFCNYREILQLQENSAITGKFCNYSSGIIIALVIVVV